MTEPNLPRRIRATIKQKLIGTFAALVLVNSAYFVFAAHSVSSMGRLALGLYDEVTMVATYCQSAKFHYARYLQAVESSLLAEQPAALAKARQEAEDEFVSFGEDLGVVIERAKVPAEAALAESVKAKLPGIEASGTAALEEAKSRADAPTAARLQAAREWERTALQSGVMAALGSLSDRVVADGYSVRLAAEEKSRTAWLSSVAAALFVLVINLSGAVAILWSLLPSFRLLTQRCNEIATGSFDTKVEMASGDEFGILAAAMNFMLSIIRQKEERLREELRTTSVMLDSLGQGLFLFESSGLCRPTSSRACADIFGMQPGGKPVHEVLHVSSDKAQNFHDWVTLLFAGQLEFEELTALGEPRLANPQNRFVALEYKPVFDDAGNVQAVMVVGTDKTAERDERRRAEEEHAFSRMVIALTKNRRQCKDFLVYAENLSSSTLRVPEGNFFSKERFAETLRAAHTLKGGAALLSILPIRDQAHRFETSLAAYAEDLESHGSALTALTHEFANTLGQILFMFRQEHEDLLENHRDTAASADFRESVHSKLRAYAGSVQELADDCRKKLFPLLVEGSDLPFEAKWDDLLRSLVHAFRNSLDHGIEAPSERTAAGKNPAGQIRIFCSAEKEGAIFQISIEDDGRGIDPSFLRAKLRDCGLAETALAASDEEILQRIFESGFSTRDTVTELSGRGVGMDAIRAETLKLGGEALVISTKGVGTRIQIRIPITRQAIQAA